MIKIGDRGNFKIGDIYLYTHWNGIYLKSILQEALKRHQRWTDEAYLTRIIFCTMIKDDVMSETGYGISTHICDNEHPILEVDVKNQKIYEKECKFGEKGHELTKKPSKTWTFEEFCNARFEEE